DVLERLEARAREAKRELGDQRDQGRRQERHWRYLGCSSALRPVQRLLQDGVAGSVRRELARAVGAQPKLSRPLLAPGWRHGEGLRMPHEGPTVARRDLALLTSQAFHSKDSDPRRSAAQLF